MASAGSLTVEIGADIASLRSGVQEAITRTASLEKSVKTSAANMQSSFESSLGGIHSAYIKAAAGIGTAIYAMGKVWKLANIAAEYEEQRGYLENLSAKYNTTADDIVSSMQRASDGLVAKTDLMQIALQGIAKGLKPDQMINLAHAATILGDAVGKDATTAMRELTEALETGRTRGLIKLTNTSLDAKAAFGGLETQLTLTEKAQWMYAEAMIYSNSIEVQQIKAIDDSADKMEQMEAQYKDLTLEVGNYAKALVISTAAFGKWILEHNILTDKNAAFPGWDTMIAGKKASKAGKEPTSPMAKIATPKTPEKSAKDLEYEATIAGLKKIAQARADAEKAKKDSEKNAIKDLAAAKREEEKAYDTSLRVFEVSENGKVRLAQATADSQIKQIESVFNRSSQSYSDELSFITNKSAILEAVNRTEADSIQAQIENLGRSQEKKAEIAKLTGEWELANQAALQVTSDMELAILDMRAVRAAELDNQITEIQARLDDMASSSALSDFANVAGPNAGALMEIGMGKDKYTEQISATEEMHAAMLESAIAYADDTSAVYGGAASRLRQIEEENIKSTTATDKLKFQQRVSIAKSSFGMMGDLAEGFYNASGQQSEAAFTAMKAFRIAETIVNTYSAAMGAYNAMASIPYVGPALGAAAAAAAVAFGAMQVANIASMEPGGSRSVAGASAPAAGAPATVAVAAPTAQAPAMAKEEVIQASPTIQIYVQGNIIDQDKFARELVPAITRAMGDGVR